MNLVGERVKAIRRMDGLSQDQLCGRISSITRGLWGPTADDIYRIEAGSRIVSDLEMVAIAAALNRECDDFIQPAPGRQSAKELAASLFGGDA